MKRLFSLLLTVCMLFSLTACQAPPPEGGGELEVHFLDVGQADCALIMCDGESMLIDGGNTADSSLLYSYLQKEEIDYLSCIIATHPHEDHIGGLPGALSYAGCGECFSPVTEYDSRCFQKLKDKLTAMDAPITVPSPGDGFDLGGAHITFLGPKEITDDQNENSIVCRLDYGDVSFLFTGDAGRQSEKQMLEDGLSLEADVLKVGHHGSSGSSCYEFLRAVNPHYAVISTEDNSRYGHPHEETLSRLKDCGAEIYRTDKHGTIVFCSDGSVLTVSSQKTEQAEDTGSAMYIGNLSSEIYHRPTCPHLPAERNRIYFYTLEDAINSGYSPCGACKP